MIEKAFRKGLNEARNKDLHAIDEEIKAVLGIRSRQQYAKYKDGRMSLSVDEYDEIKKIFRARGISQPFGK